MEALESLKGCLCLIISENSGCRQKEAVKGGQSYYFCHQKTKKVSSQ